MEFIIGGDYNAFELYANARLRFLAKTLEILSMFIDNDFIWYIIG
jgi:hypothetical protein